MKKRDPLEDAEQIFTVAWLRSHGHQTTRVDPGHFRGTVGQRVGQWKKHEAMGGTAGDTDLVLDDMAPIDGKPVRVEMKRSRGTLSDRQRVRKRALEAKGWHVVVGRGADDAIEKLKALGFGARRGTCGSSKEAMVSEENIKEEDSGTAQA